MSSRGRGGRATAKAKASATAAAAAAMNLEQENDEPTTATSSSSSSSSSSSASASCASATTTTATAPVAVPSPKPKSKYRAKVVKRTSSLEASLAAAASQNPLSSVVAPLSSLPGASLDYFSVYSMVSSAVRKPPSELRPPLLTEPSNEEPPVELKPEDKALVDEMLQQLRLLKDVLGGVKRRNEWELDEQGDPKIVRKLTRRELQDAYTDYEYIVLHIKGFVAIEERKATVIKLNNHQFFTSNPGVKLLEKYTGITLHGDRPEANSIVESAFNVLLTAFKLAKAEGDFKKFFTTAFDRTADPCLEGRVGRLQLYIENSPYYWKNDAANGDGKDELAVRWRDFNLLFEERASDDKEACFGEFLRVFLNTTALKYAKSVGKPYDEVQNSRAKGLPLPGFYENFCNAKLFREFLSENGVSAAATAAAATAKKTAKKKQKSDEKKEDAATKTKTRCPFEFTTMEVNTFIDAYSEFLLP